MRARRGGIVSLVPSDTYSLVALGAADRIVGRTRYCVEPADVVAGIRALGGRRTRTSTRSSSGVPDLVIANQEENTKRDLERIAQAGIAVFVSFPKRVAEGLAHLARLAQLLDVADDATREGRSCAGTTTRCASRGVARARIAPVRAFCPIWMDPLMTVNGGHVHLRRARPRGSDERVRGRGSGATRSRPIWARVAPLSSGETAGRDTRYPRITWEEVVELAPELIVLPDEPHPFSEADAERFRALDVPASRRGAIVFANGKDFSWYGARGLEGIERMRSLVAAHAS